MKLFKSFLYVILVFLMTSFLNSNDTDVKRQWSSYRGYYANGILDNTAIPEKWDLEEGTNIKWKADIPGLGLSCPILWEDRLFITSAISQTDNSLLRAGGYVSSDPVEDTSIHDFNVYCYNSKTGDLLWEKTAYTGVPKVKRHPKATHANCTPATDGKHLVVFFASEGLYCYNMEGKLLWTKDLGRLHAGAFAEHREDMEWEFGSSPLIHKNVVLIQCDVRGDSFLAAYEVATGKEIWKKERDEYPGWCTPNIYTQNGRDLVVVNGYKHRGAYDFLTGDEIWKMSGGGDIPVPTPQIGDSLLYFNSAHGRYAPIFAIKKDAEGDITLEDKQTTNDYVKWSQPRGGSYMHTLLLYNNLLFNVGWNGNVECLDPSTGEQHYKKSIGESTIASPVASDGKIYVVSDHGMVYTLKASPEFEILAKNNLGEVCMTVPALSDNIMYFRTQSQLIAVSEE